MYMCLCVCVCGGGGGGGVYVCVVVVVVVVVGGGGGGGGGGGARYTPWNMDMDNIFCAWVSCDFSLFCLQYFTGIEIRSTANNMGR